MNGSVSIMDVEDGHQLTITMKEGDYDYLEYNMPAGEPYYYFQTERQECGKSRTESHDIFEAAYRYKDSPFQIVPIHKDIETEFP
jgi:hypothetical protein